MSELFCWLGGVDVGCIQKDLVTHLELGSRSSLLIVVPHHVILGLCEGSVSLFKCGLHATSKLIDCFNL
jgi:hypothetical protein